MFGWDSYASPVQTGRGRQRQTEIAREKESKRRRDGESSSFTVPNSAQGCATAQGPQVSPHTHETWEERRRGLQWVAFADASIAPEALRGLSDLQRACLHCAYTPWVCDLSLRSLCPRPLLGQMRLSESDGLQTQTSCFRDADKILVTWAGSHLLHVDVRFANYTDEHVKAWSMFSKV